MLAFVRFFFGLLLHLLSHLRRILRLLLHWCPSFLSVMSPSVVLKTASHATEIRLTTSARPPPVLDPASHRRGFWLIVGCIVVIQSSHLIRSNLLFRAMNPDASTLTSEDYKPTLAELDAMLHQAELVDRIDHDPSSRSTSSSPMDDVHLDSAVLAQAVAAVVTSALRATQRGLPASPTPAHPP
jgi:hypothetical protein